MDRHRKARFVLFVAAVVLFGGQYQPSYAGNTVSVTLTWSCGGGPVWSDAGRVWVSELPVHGIIEADPPPAPVREFAQPPTHSIGGRLHFDSADDSTFTSDAGGWFRMRRLPPNTFPMLSCSLTPWP